jgi:hypothetical protein
MATFTIDTGNDIAAQTEVPVGSESLQSFATGEGIGEARRRVAHP